jgi:MerR family transcriptional regulator, heat shock protein HspR
MSPLKQNSDSREPEFVFTLEIVSARTGVSPSRVRYFERQGLITGTSRTSGQRTYSLQTVERIEQINRLTHDLGVNLAGAEVILNMRDRMIELIDEIDRLQERS